MVHITTGRHWHEATAEDLTAHISDKGWAWVTLGSSAESDSTSIHFASVEELRKFVKQAADELRKHDEAEQFAEHLEREKREGFAEGDPIENANELAEVEQSWDDLQGEDY